MLRSATHASLPLPPIRDLDAADLIVDRALRARPPATPGEGVERALALYRHLELGGPAPAGEAIDRTVSGGGDLTARPLATAPLDPAADGAAWHLLLSSPGLLRAPVEERLPRLALATAASRGPALSPIPPGRFLLHAGAPGLAALIALHQAGRSLPASALALDPEAVALLLASDAVSGGVYRAVNWRNGRELGEIALVEPLPALGLFLAQLGIAA